MVVFVLGSDLHWGLQITQLDGRQAASGTRESKSQLCDSLHKAAGTVAAGAASSAPAPLRVTLRLLSDRCADLRANYVAGDHYFHTPILLPALGSVVGSHWLSFSETLRRD